MTSATPFLDKLGQAERACGLYFFQRYISEEEASKALTILDSEEFPWNLKPRLYGQKLNQHSYLYERAKKKKKNEENLAGIETLESFCQKLESDFDGCISEVYCNRFANAKHDIPWHKDTYGAHIFVLSFGSSRTVQFRHDKSKVIEEVVPKSGDLYFMPLGLNSTHKHRVCPGPEENDDADETRLSFVFFFESPKYATDFRITRKDKVKGFFETLMS